LFKIIWEKNPANYYFFFVVPARYHGKRGGKKKRPSISKSETPTQQPFYFSKCKAIIPQVSLPSKKH
jgi:hypothetical protein